MMHNTQHRARLAVELLEDRALLSASLFDPFPSLGELFSADPALASEPPAPAHASGDLNAANPYHTDYTPVVVAPSQSYQNADTPSPALTAPSASSPSSGVDPQMVSALANSLASTTTIRAPQNTTLAAGRDGPLVALTTYLYVSDPKDTQVYRFNLATGVQDTNWKLSGTLPGSPQGIKWYGNLLYVADNKSNKIRVYDVNGVYQKDFEKQTDPVGPVGLAFNANGDLFVTDTGNGAINRYYGPGAGANAGNDEPAPGKTGATYIKGAPLKTPYGIAFDAQGPPQNLYVADNLVGEQIVKYANTGTTGAVLVGPLADPAYDVTFDGNGNLYFSFWGVTNGSHEVDKYTFSTGKTTTYAKAELKDPEGIIWGGDPSTFFVADNFNNKIVQYQDNNGVGQVVQDPWTKVNTPTYIAIK